MSFGFHHEGREAHEGFLSKMNPSCASWLQLPVAAAARRLDAQAIARPEAQFDLSRQNLFLPVADEDVAPAGARSAAPYAIGRAAAPVREHGRGHLSQRFVFPHEA